MYKSLGKYILQGDIIINPDYSNMDILDVMLATNRKELEWVCYLFKKKKLGLCNSFYFL